jgi:endonuclease/exonuclease/phosphatase family metal-dependent hydrolase
MRKWIIAILTPPSLLALFILWAHAPAVSPKELPSSGIVQFAGIPSEEGSSSLSSPKELRIVTYNIGYASGVKNNTSEPLSRSEVEGNLKAMVKALKELRPDLVFLQEVDFDAARTFRINQMVALARGLGMPYAAYVLTWNKNYLPWPYWPLKGQFGRIVSGQAVLSRFPIEKQELLRFPKPSSNPFWYNWFYLDRIAQKIVLKGAPEPRVVWNVHLEAFDSKTRLEQVERLGRWVEEETIPEKWVAGDFNSVSVYRKDLPDEERKNLEDNGESLQRFQEITGLKNAETREAFFTIPSWAPVKKIDHIFYSEKGFRLKGTGTSSGLTASDHLPVWSEFTPP